MSKKLNIRALDDFLGWMFFGLYKFDPVYLPKISSTPKTVEKGQKNSTFPPNHSLGNIISNSGKSNLKADFWARI